MEWHFYFHYNVGVTCVDLEFQNLEMLGLEKTLRMNYCYYARPIVHTRLNFKNKLFLKLGLGCVSLNF